MNDDLRIKKKQLMHRMVPYFEDVVCYELDDILHLFSISNALREEKQEEKIEELLSQGEELLFALHKKENAPEPVYLWRDGNMPSLNRYLENVDYEYNHDPDFKPYLYEMLVAENVKPKGAVVVCAGGDHGDCNLHEGYQTCVNMNRLGYQCFLLLNRTNMRPYDGTEAGADAARAIQYVRKHAKRFRITENQIAFAGFSNGGLTGEACIQYYSGTQKIKTHFSDYIEDEYDAYYGAPDAFICVYGPRWKGVPFDYINAVYPPVFFAVGREDQAMDNLNAVYPELLAQGIEVEVHTFSGVPHGQSGVEIYGNHQYDHFGMWVPLADHFMQNVFAKSIVKQHPDEICDRNYRFDSFADKIPFTNKKTGRLPAMGWNSWNAFGSGNTEALTKQMADDFIRLSLDQLGYEYLVLDDGCYKPERVNGKLANEEKKFPSGFKALSDYIHEKGLKFGMYNDIGTNLCAGAAVGTCGHEVTDAKSYIDWGVDFLKVDNCYYLFDNATFSNASNAKYVFAPKIYGFSLIGDQTKSYHPATDGMLTGERADISENFVTGIGTFDGTGPDRTPIGLQSSELIFSIQTDREGAYELVLDYEAGQEEGIGNWLQIAVENEAGTSLYYDDFVMEASKDDNLSHSIPIKLDLRRGENKIRLMNHRRQENTLCSYAALFEALKEADDKKDIVLSMCEWGKTQPQNWGYKIGDSWRILNDITFQVGADGDPGMGSWTSDYTNSVMSQYNKAVIMDEFSGKEAGYNDPDMLMIGMNGLTQTMNQTHMTMWCMMNAPLMLGLDLRRVEKGDWIHRIIANEELIALNQDALGIQAKRIYSTKATKQPDREYIRDNDRVDVLAKPLSDNGMALSFINVSDKDYSEPILITVDDIVKAIGHKMVDSEAFVNAKEYLVLDLWQKESTKQCVKVFCVESLKAYDNQTIKIIPM